LGKALVADLLLGAVLLSVFCLGVLVGYGYRPFRGERRGFVDLRGLW
jgi:hypothetical protein